jgi:hypothetical protein
VNNANAIRNGALAGKPRFFGDALAEAVSNPEASSAVSWNNDEIRASNLANSPWFTRGGQSFNQSTNGVFATLPYASGDYAAGGHRTILSGY